MCYFSIIDCYSLILALFKSIFWSFLSFTASFYLNYSFFSVIFFVGLKISLYLLLIGISSSMSVFSLAYLSFFSRVVGKIKISSCYIDSSNSTTSIQCLFFFIILVSFLSAWILHCSRFDCLLYWWSMRSITSIGLS